MTRKRDTPEALLHRVLEDLEASEHPIPSRVPLSAHAAQALEQRALAAALPRWRRGLLALERGGPLRCVRTAGRDPILPPADPSADQPDDPTVAVTRAEVLAFLHQAVRLRHAPVTGNPIKLLGPPHYFTRVLRLQVVVIEAHAMFRDLIVLQLALLDRVGLGQLRACVAPDCSRLFVKTYRREFCSLRCQQRTLKRRAREAARERHERQRRRRRVTKGSR